MFYLETCNTDLYISLQL